MENHWRQFLTDFGAAFVDDIVNDYGDRTAEYRAVLSSNVIADLSHLGLIEVGGDDANEFLHGQFTSDVDAITPRHSQLSAWCTPKGQVLAIFLIFRHGEHYYLLLPRELVDMTIHRLRGYVLRAAVAMADASTSLARIGIAGDDVATYLKHSVGDVPHVVNDATQNGTVTLLAIPGPTPRFLVVGKAARLQAVWQALASEVTPVGAGPWALLDILAGIPSIYPATSEAFLPQMLNLHALGALSFQKGCFPGQEVIARVKYRGKLKRRTYLAHLDTDAVPDPGDALFEVRSRERIGQVLNARPHPDGGIAMLAVIETEAAASTEVRLHRDEGPTVQVQPLPYSLNAA